MAQMSFNVRYLHLSEGSPTAAIKCSELLDALGVSKGREKFRKLLATAFPTLDARQFPQGEPQFADLWISKENALSLLRGAGPTLKADPAATAKLPKVMAVIAAIEQP